jgi:hypothetical protein
MTNPGPPPDDFELAKGVFEKLKDLPTERKERVLRWVAEGLGLSMVPPRDATRASIERGIIVDAPRPATSEPGQARDIRSFVRAKNPASDVQFATVVAYFYRFEAPPTEQREAIDAKALREATRLVDRKRISNPLNTLNNAKKQGYLDSKGRGEFSINSVGENLVAMALTGEGSRVETASPGRKRKRPKKPRTARR